VVTDIYGVVGKRIIDAASGRWKMQQLNITRSWPMRGNKSVLCVELVSVAHMWRTRR